MSNLSVDTRVALLRQYGSFSQAYSPAFQPGLSYFGDERGFIAFKAIWGTARVLADPVAPFDNVRDLLARLLSEHPDVMFCQISRPVAEVLASRGGFFVNDLGTRDPSRFVELRFQWSEEGELSKSVQSRVENRLRHQRESTEFGAHRRRARGIACLEASAE